MLQQRSGDLRYFSVERFKVTSVLVTSTGGKLAQRIPEQFFFSERPTCDVYASQRAFWKCSPSLFWITVRRCRQTSNDCYLQVIPVSRRASFRHHSSHGNAAFQVVAVSAGVAGRFGASEQVPPGSGKMAPGGETVWGCERVAHALTSFTPALNWSIC